MSATFDVDLFGNERPARCGTKSAPIALNLFDGAAEIAALRTGRPRSQERVNLFHNIPAGEWACACGGSLGRNAHGKCGKCKQ